MTRRKTPVATPPAHVDISLQFGKFDHVAAHRALLPRTQVKQWISLALQGAGELTVRVVGRDEAQALILQFRGKDYATNVLTFDYCQEPLVMADLVLCGPVVEEEAAAQGKTLLAHYAHLLIHGCLHAQGYDHEQGAADALEMEALEILLLGALGIANPY